MYSMHNPATQTPSDLGFAERLEAYYAHSPGTHVDKLRNFTKFVPRQALSLFLAKSTLFQRVIGVHGAIVECGVFLGGGLMTWAQLSAVHEPYNHTRRVVGFDTFAGFPGISPNDAEGSLPYVHAGGLASPVEDDLRECVALHDSNRPIGHIPRVELVAGDATKSIEAYVAENRHLVVAMLYLDFDLYEPTKAAIDALLPRMPKGAILAFDELNQREWPGETLAVLDSVGIRNLRIERFPFVPQLSYAVLE